MSKKLDTTAKQIGNDLITLSDELAAEMERWSDIPSRPNDLSETECAGFISNEDTSSRLNLVVDVQAPAAENTAMLRIWAIESELDADQNERFNNIQLDFDMDYAAARTASQKGAAITRDDLQAALQAAQTRLSHIVVSNQAGLDKTSEEPLGERYDLTIGTASSQDDDSEDKICGALNTVLATLKDSAASRASDRT